MARNGLFLCLCVLAIRLFIIDIYRVESGSMRPGYEVGDLLVLLRPAYGPNFAALDVAANRWVRSVLGGGLPSAGDTIVFRLENTSFIKRVIGVGGSAVAFRDGVPVVDGAPLEQTLLSTDERGRRILLERLPDGTAYTVIGSLRNDEGSSPAPVQVPAEEVFVMGDNRESSVDSRTFGPIPAASVLGRPVWKFDIR